MPGPTHCTICGWPLSAPGAGAPCSACGAPAGSALLGEDGPSFVAFAGAQVEDFPHLEPAFIAWRQGDVNRMVGQCFQYLEIEDVKPVGGRQGPVWRFSRHFVHGTLEVDERTEQVAVEAALLYLPMATRAPLMRALLEANETALKYTRFCQRNGYVLIVFTEVLKNLAPPKLVEVLGEITEQGPLLADELAVTFDCHIVDDWPDPKELGQAARLSIVTARKAHISGAEAPGESVNAGLSSVAAAEALCKLLRGALDYVTSIQFHDFNGAKLVLLHRAIIARAYAEHGRTCPDPVALLLEVGGPLMAAGSHGSIPDHQAIEITGKLTQAYNRIILDLGQVGHQSRLQLPPFPDRASIQAYLEDLLPGIETVASDSHFHHFLLASLFAELIVRLPSQPGAQQSLSQALKAMVSAGPGEEARRLAYQALEEFHGP